MAHNQLAVPKSQRTRRRQWGATRVSCYQVRDL